jgi:hypothetical protein
MKEFRGPILLLLLLGVAIFAASRVYIVRAPDPQNPRESIVRIFPKKNMTLIDTYLDTHGWRASDLSDHRAAVEQMIESGHGYLVASAY